MANGTPDSASLLASSASASPRPSAERLLTQESAEDRLEAVGPLDVGQVLAVGDEFERSFFEARDRLFRLRVGKYPIARTPHDECRYSQVRELIHQHLALSSEADHGSPMRRRRKFELFELGGWLSLFTELPRGHILGSSVNTGQTRDQYSEHPISSSTISSLFTCVYLWQLNLKGCANPFSRTDGDATSHSLGQISTDGQPQPKA
jgi:hypothetical protein